MFFRSNTLGELYNIICSDVLQFDSKELATCVNYALFESDAFEYKKIVNNKCRELKPQPGVRNRRYSSKSKYKLYLDKVEKYNLKTGYSEMLSHITTKQTLGMWIEYIQTIEYNLNYRPNMISVSDRIVFMTSRIR